MSVDAELEEILLRWEELRERGESPAIEDVCRDHPGRLEEVRQLIEALESLDGLMAEPPVDAAADPAEGRMPEEVYTGSRYRTVRAHARGGLGEIFVAWDEELGREVALKLIRHPYGGDAERRERFLREAEITARLGHPGIVPIFGVGRADGARTCYAMRFIEGQTLQEAIARFHEADGPQRDPHERTLVFRDLLSRLVAVCHAVAFAHSRGVIHRDLKPPNIMLGSYQETLVVDWGMAKRLGDVSAPAPIPGDGGFEIEPPPAAPDAELDDVLTRHGSTMGTPAYMSPEQAAGLGDEVGPSSDIYSLGATLYCLLTGRPPFASQSRSTLLDRVRRGEFPSPRQVKRSTPRALEAICRKAMALRPADRYATVGELTADLNRWLADEPVAAWREPALVRLGRWVRRHKPLVAGTAALAATALVALAVSTVLLGREQAKTSRALDVARSNYRLARTTTAVMQTAFGLAAAERHAPAESALWFAQAAVTADVDPERAVASRVRARAWSKLSPTPFAAIDFTSNHSPDRGSSPWRAHVAFDRSGRFLLADLELGDFWVHDVLRDEPVPLPGSPRVVTAAAWGGPAGDLLALGGPDGEVELIRFPAIEVVERFRAVGHVSGLDFSPDGRLLAVGGQGVRVWDVAGKTYVTRVFLSPARVVRIAFSPRADRLAAAAADGRVRVHDLAASRLEPLFEIRPSASPPTTIPAHSPLQPLFVDDGRGLVILSSDRELAWHDAATGAVVRTLPTSLITVYHVFLSPDGRAITVTGLGGVRAWDARTGQPLGRFGEAGIEAAAFTRDGTRLLLSDGYRVTSPVRFPGGEPGGWTLKQQETAGEIAVAQGAEHFALAQRSGLVTVWRFPESPSVSLQAVSTRAWARFAMSADGRLVMPVGKYLLTGPSATRVHDLSSGRAGPDLHVDGILHGGDIAPDGRHVVTLSSPAGVAPAGVVETQYPVGTSKGRITFWDWQRGVPAFEPTPTPSEPLAAAYRPGGGSVVVLCARGERLGVDAATGRVLYQSDAAADSRYMPGWPVGELLRLSPDGSVLAKWTGRLGLFDAASGTERSPGLAWPASGGNHYLLDARFSPDGRYLATAGAERAARVWDLATGQLASPPLAHPDWIFEVAFSPDGALLLTAARDGNARVWDWRSGQLRGLPMLHSGEVQQARFVEGGRWVLTKSSVGGMADLPQNALQVWNWRTGEPLTPPRLVPSPWGAQLRLTPDGSRAVIGGFDDRAVNVIDLRDWIDGDDPQFPAEHLGEITELFSGQRIVGGSTVVGLTRDEWVRRWRSYRSYARQRAPAVTSPALGGPQ